MTIQKETIMVDSRGQVQVIRPSGPVVGTVEADSFAPATFVANLDPGEERILVVHLLRYGRRIPFSADELSIIESGGVRVTIPPGSIATTDENGDLKLVTGPVEMTLVQLDPTTDLVMSPGQLRGVPEGSDKTPVPLLSQVMANITLWRGDEKLRLADGAEVTVEMVLPDALQQTPPASPVEAWWLDEKEGIWVQDGFGSIEPSTLQPGKLAWIKHDVKHFTWWNADKPPSLTGCALVSVLDDQGHKFSLPKKPEAVASPLNYSYAGGWIEVMESYDYNTGHACLDVMMDSTNPMFKGEALVYARMLDSLPFQSGAPVKVTGMEAFTSCKTTAKCQPAPPTAITLRKPVSIKARVVAGNPPANVSNAEVIARFDQAFWGWESRTATKIVDNGVTYYCIDGLPPGANVTTEAAAAVGTDYRLGAKTMKTPDLTSDCTKDPSSVPTKDPSGEEYKIDLDCTDYCVKHAARFGDADHQYIVDAVFAKGGVSDTFSAFFAGNFRGSLDPYPYQATGQDMFIARYGYDTTMQMPVSVNIVTAFGGPSDDFITGITSDNEGNLYVTGYFSQSMVLLGASLLGDNQSNETDGFVAKIDPDGGPNGAPKLIWLKKIGGLGNQLPQGIAVQGNGLDDDVNFLVTVVGYFNGAFQLPAPCKSSQCANVPAPGKQDNDIFVATFSTEEGLPYAASIFGGSGDERGKAVATGTDGQYYVTGDFQGQVTAANTTISANDQDVFVLKMKIEKATPANLVPTPKPVWLRAISGAGVQSVNDITVQRTSLSEAGDLIWLTGYSTDTIVYPQPLPPNLILADFQGGASDIFVMELSAGGNTLWADNLGGTGDEEGTGIEVLTQKPPRVALTGWSNGKLDFKNGNVKSAIGVKDVFLATIDFDPLTGAAPYPQSIRFGGVNSAADFSRLAVGRDTYDIAAFVSFRGTIDFDAAYSVTSNGAFSDVGLAHLLLPFKSNP